MLSLNFGTISKTTISSFLLTNRLNQDCIENLFSSIRRSGGNRDNPSCEEFAPAFKQCLIECILTPSKGANCLEDGDTIISTLSDFHNLKTSSPTEPCVPVSPANPTIDDDKITDISEMINSLPQRNTLTYIGGYVLHKLKSKHKCNTCRIDSVTSPASSQMNDNELFCHWKALCTTGNFGGLTVPTECFLQYISEMENIFLCNFNSLAHMDKIIFRLTKLFANSLKPDLMLCESALLFVQIHYLTIRIHAALKFHRQSESTTQKPQRKLLKILHL